MTPLPRNLPEIAEAYLEQAYVLVRLSEADIVLRAQLRYNGLVGVGRVAQPIGVHVAEAQHSLPHERLQLRFFHFLFRGEEESLRAFDEFRVHRDLFF